MKSSKHLFAFSAMLIFMLVLSSGVYAQYGHGRRYAGYYSYHPHVSVIRPYYSYHPVYPPPIYYHPYYRLPYPYVHYGPAFGLSINILPFGYSQFFIGGNPFYYYNGIYYQPHPGGGYAVTQPPLGAVVKHLPSGAKVTVIDGQKYYVLGGTFYQEKVGANKKLSYEVVGTDGVLNTANANANNDKEIGQAPAIHGNNNTPTPNEAPVINKLPAGSTAVTISQQKYYLSPAGVYYEEMIDANNKITYKAVGSSTTPETKINEVPGDIQ